MPQPTHRAVRCYHCKGGFDVPSAARSASCPLCFRGLNLDDLRVEGNGYSLKLNTCGTVTIDKKARAVTRQVDASEGVEVLGHLEAKVQSLGPVFVGKAARIKGEYSAPSITIELGAVVDAVFRIGTPATLPT